MLILVEGADGSGKTKLVENLKKRGFKVEPTIPRNLSSQGMRWNFLCLKSCELGRRHIIVDRSFISELVYRTFDGGKPYMSIADMGQCLRLCKIIYCETDTQYKDSMNRGEDNIVDEVSADKIKRLYRFYINMFQQFDKVPVFVYNWKKTDISEVSDFIKKPMQRR